MAIFSLNCVINDCHILQHVRLCSVDRSWSNDQPLLSRDGQTLTKIVRHLLNQVSLQCNVNFKFPTPVMLSVFEKDENDTFLWNCHPMYTCNGKLMYKHTCQCLGDVFQDNPLTHIAEGLAVHENWRVKNSLWATTLMITADKQETARCLINIAN